MSELREIIYRLQIKHPELSSMEIVEIIIDILNKEFPQILERLELVDLDNLLSRYETRIKISRQSLRSRIIRQFEEKKMAITAFERAKSNITYKSETANRLLSSSIMAIQGTNSHSMSMEVIPENHIGGREIDYPISDGTWNYNSQSSEPTWAEKLNKKVEKRRSSKKPSLSPSFLELIGLLDEEPLVNSDEIERKVVGEYENLQ